MATQTQSKSRRVVSYVLAAVTVALPAALALVAPSEVVLPLALALPFATMIWLETARPAVNAGRVSVA